MTAIEIPNMIHNPITSTKLESMKCSETLWLPMLSEMSITTMDMDTNNNRDYQRLNSIKRNSLSHHL